MSRAFEFDASIFLSQRFPSKHLVKDENSANFA